MSETDPPASPEPAALAPPRSVGELLREGRARMHLSAADVARHLRLSLRQVEALEANDFAALPGNTIVRGFIRNYARLLQMDAAPLLAAYEAALPAPQGEGIAPRAERIDISPRPSRRWLLYLASVLLLLVGAPLAIYALLHDDGRPAVPAAPRPKATPEAVGSAGKTELPLPPAPPLAPAVPPAAAPAAATDAPQAAAPEGAAQLAGGARLSFTFDEDAWVEVRDRHGNKIFSRLGRKGEEEALTGEGPFSLVIGNAHHVRLAYNGKPVDLAPHIKINVARLTLE